MYYFWTLLPHIYLFLSTYEDVTLKIIPKVLSRALTISHLISFRSSTCSLPCNAVAFSLLDHAKHISTSVFMFAVLSAPRCLHGFLLHLS